MSIVTPIQTNGQLAETIRTLRLENEELKTALTQSKANLARLNNRGKIALNKIHSLMDDIKRYKKQLPAH